MQFNGIDGIKTNTFTLFGKKRARSVARMQCFMLPRTWLKINLPQNLVEYQIKKTMMPGSQEMVAFNTREQNWFVNEKSFKPEARSSHTCLYSSGFSLEKMLWCSCKSISKLEICFKSWCFGEGDEYEWMSMRPVGGYWWPWWSMIIQIYILSLFLLLYHMRPVGGYWWPC